MGTTSDAPLLQIDSADNPTSSVTIHKDTSACESLPTISPETPVLDTSLRRAYLFLQSKSVSALRLIAGKYGVLQAGASKEIFVARMFVYVHEAVLENGQSVDALLGSDYGWGFQEFINKWTAKQERTTIPHISQIRHTAAKKVQRTSSAGRGGRARGSSKMLPKKRSTTTGSPPSTKRQKQSAISNQDFARLLLVFRDHPEIQHYYGQCLTKDQLDNGEKSKDVWVKIATLFMDSSFKPTVCFGALIETIDVTETPSVPRDGAALQRVMRSFQSHWDHYQIRYRASGQNDPDFGSYLERIDVDTVSSQGQRLLICADLCSLGTPDEDTSFLDLLSRRIGYDVGTGGEGGMEHPNEKIETVARSDSKTDDTRRRSRDRSSFGSQAVTSNAVKEACNAFRDRCANESTDWDWNEMEGMIKSLKRAKVEQVNEEDDEIRENWDKYATALRTRIASKSPNKKKS